VQVVSAGAAKAICGVSSCMVRGTTSVGIQDPLAGPQIERGEDCTTTDGQVVQLGYSLPQPSRIPVNASALMPCSSGSLAGMAHELTPPPAALSRISHCEPFGALVGYLSFGVCVFWRCVRSASLG
jgi:hypothetical protein